MQRRRADVSRFPWECSDRRADRSAHGNQPHWGVVMRVRLAITSGVAGMLAVFAVAMGTVAASASAATPTWTAW
jgi:hypothetical protein